MRKLTVLVIVCLLVTSTLAQNKAEENNKPTNNEKSEGDAQQQQPQNDGRAFPTFNTQGTLAPQPHPQQPLLPQPPQGIPGGFPEDGVGFNPYASPQIGFGGYYPQIPFQPQPPQGYPGQPQIVYYSGTGQPFLVNPGNPPGNFLIPQFPQQPGQPVDPSVFNTQPVYPPLTPQNPQGPQTPVFIGGGFPKQPVIPPIDKDAEEIPKNIPMQGTVSNVPTTQKPQKLELDGSDDEPVKNQPGSPQGFPGNVPNLLNLYPGQRFFVLNGQPLYSNYQGPQSFGYPQPNAVPERYINPYIVHQQRPHHQQIDPEQFKPIGPSLANIILHGQPQRLRQHVVPSHLKNHHFPQQPDGLPLTLHNQVVDKNIQSVILTPATLKNTAQSRYYEKTIPFDEQQIPLQQEQEPTVFESAPAGNFDYYKYNDADGDSAIIIDAKYQEPNEVEDDSEGETEKPVESSVAEAQPNAIALAGEGGVAAAGPRGTALAGQGGLAVSSPHATAVAGPAKDTPAQSTEDKKKPATKTK